MSTESQQRWWPIVVGVLVAQIILGTVHAFTAFVKPLQTELGRDRTTTQRIFSMALAVFAIVTIPAGGLQDLAAFYRLTSADLHGLEVSRWATRYGNVSPGLAPRPTDVQLQLAIQGNSRRNRAPHIGI